MPVVAVIVPRSAARGGTAGKAQGETGGKVGVTGVKQGGGIKLGDKGEPSVCIFYRSRIRNY